MKKQRYKVRGYALVPVEVVVELNSKSEKTAIAYAARLFSRNPQRYIIHRSEDYAAAFDFQSSGEVTTL